MELAMPLEDRDRGADDGLHVGQRCTNDVVGADAGRDRCLHEGGIVLIDEEDDGTWLLRRDGADAVERIAIGPRHVDDNYVRRLYPHRLRERLVRPEPGDDHGPAATA